jgi:chromosome segregation ATPase
MTAQEEYDDMRAAMEEMRDVHQYELEQARQEHQAASSSAHRIINQEKEAAEQKIRGLEAALDSARKQVNSVQSDKDLLDRRLSQSALENVKLKEKHDRVCAEKENVESKLKRVSSQLETADYQVLL